MITVLIVLAVALAAGTALTLAGVSPWYWSILWAALVFLAGQLALGWFLRRRMGALNDRIQATMRAAQARMQAKVQRWRTGRMTNQKAAEAELARDRDAMIAEVQAILRPLERLRPWIPLLGRQLATMELQFAWQRRDWARVDALLPRALLLEPLLVCMKLARMWQRDAPTAELRKVFRKATRRARYGTTALIYATWSWMLVRRGEVDEAFKALVEADAKNEHPTLKANRDHLANNRVQHFSNAGFGEEWYALGLEAPKIRAQRVRDPGRYFL